MELLSRKCCSAKNYILTFFKWIIFAGITGFIGGLIGTAFHLSVERATEFRVANNWVLYFLPVGGIAIAVFYKLFKMTDSTGTNQIIDSIRTDDHVPIILAPLIFVSTVITHLFGGSAGREGAALQLGGSIGTFVGNIFKLDNKDMHLIVLCGMSGVFSALFGTPLTATLFAMEVISIGVIYYSSLVPCLASSLVAYGVSLFFGIAPVHYDLSIIPVLSLKTIALTAVLAALLAELSIIFCVVMHKTEHLMKHKIKDDYLRGFIGGLIVLLLTMLIKTHDYNGAGMDIVQKAIDGIVKPEAFLLKIIFTAITIGAGFKGGEIVPTFFIGATFGCFAGGLLGLDPGFSAALGLVSLFCGVVNAPIASIILSIELFGSEGIIFFAIACSVSYMLSGYYGLYSSQKIVYSKLKAEFININAK
ncbi:MULTISPECIES: chloride channel protein [unclassified Sedimentibacter]|uniref:chloride channel protein n=1 Tax=unclassified Sedimentibacter TaxID=2649220 RepID=UPI0027E0BB81|nr:chloride channel protein [Sedimentibacter sp. MB35-C1]WMJ76511.1 chloride channel protein [Sedimentibacter sp. MB35-C1]